MNNFSERINACKNHLDRCEIAADLEIPNGILASFIKVDVEYEVVEAAALNPTCTDDLIAIAISRFPSLESNDFWARRARRVKSYRIKTEIAMLEAKHFNLSSGDRDEIIRKHILALTESTDHAASHLGNNNNDRELVKFVNPEFEWDKTDKYKIAMVIAPSWGVLFPPYNIAKLTGLMRADGFSVKTYDANIESYHHLLRVHNEDYWRSERYFLWIDKGNFEKYLLPDLIPLFDKIIKDIIVAAPKVIGFSIYNTNMHATAYLLEELRILLPHTCFIAGGPEVVERHISGAKGLEGFNYLFVGEAEETLLTFLNDLPNVNSLEKNKAIGNTKSRLNLNELAYPDYSDYIFSNYQQKNGVSIETSRGCIAQCSFCSETYYWKFRSLEAIRVVDEIEYQMDKFKVDRFWFVDSLINGDIKNFERIVDLIIERNLKIQWNSYARCNGKMDLAFLTKVKKSGCTCLSYGVESGSQKILDDMRKKVKVHEIEENLINTTEAGIFPHVNWLIGFPTEEPIDFLHSLQLLFNSRSGLQAISLGYGAGPAAGSHIATDPEIYNISPNSYFNHWATNNLRNTIVHRFLRIKFTHIWLAILNKFAGAKITDSISYSSLDQFYLIDNIEQTKMVRIDHQNNVNFMYKDTSFNNSIISEYRAFFYAIFLYFGKFNLTIICDPDIDKKTFGDFIARNYKSTISICAETDGNYVMKVDHTFIHETYNQRYLADMSFSEQYIDEGNFNQWATLDSQVKDSIHRRKFTKNIIPIIHVNQEI